MKKLKTHLNLIFLCALITSFLTLTFIPVFATDQKENTQFDASLVIEDQNEPAQGDIIVTYDFKKPQINEITIENQIYNTVKMEGVFNSLKEGEPQLPIQGARIYIPEGKQYRAAKVIFSQPQEIKLTHPVIHGPGYRLEEIGEDKNKQFVAHLDIPRSDAYLQSTSYPDEDYELTSIQNMRGYRIALFNLYPVKYIPNENKLLFYNKITLKIELEPAETQRDTSIRKRSLQADFDKVLSVVDNKKDVEPIPSNPLKGGKGNILLGQEGPFDYVIITNQELADTPGEYNFQELIEFRESEGLTATIVIVDGPNSIYANYSGLRPSGGQDNQTKIRNFITAAYNQWDTQYILLAGDADFGDVGGESGDLIVPVRHFHLPYMTYPDFYPADMYYECLAGSFDYNANGAYGEPNDGPGGGEVDFYAEVAVGRVPVDSEDEVSNFVRKTLAYEKAKKDYLPYLVKTLHVGQWGPECGAFPDCFAKYCVEETRLGSSNHGFTTEGFPINLDRNTLYDKDGLWDPEQLIQNINEGVHIVNHLGLGQYYEFMKLSQLDVDELLVNKEYFIGYSHGNLGAAIDNMEVSVINPGVINVFTWDSVLEHLITGPHGAVAFVGNSRYFCGGNCTDNMDQYVARQFWDAVYGEKILKISEAHHDSREENIPYVDIYSRRVLYQMMFLGDPALEIVDTEGWKRVPEQYSTIWNAIRDIDDPWEPNSWDEGGIIFVGPGVYEGPAAFFEDGYLIGAGPDLTTIDGGGIGSSPVFIAGDSVVHIQNFHITNAGIGISNTGGQSDRQNITIRNNLITTNYGVYFGDMTDGVIENNTFIGDTAPYAIMIDDYCTVDIRNNVFVYTDVEDHDPIPTAVRVWYSDSDVNVAYNNIWQYDLPYLGEGITANDNIEEDPLFEDFEGNDYHLSLFSPSIDTGDAEDDCEREHNPHGDRIDMGAYGNTSSATFSIEHIEDRIVNYNETVSIVLDPTPYLEYQFPNLPSGATYNEWSRTFEWTPACSQSGIHNITVIATDGVKTSSGTFTIEVLGKPNNQPPVLDPIADQSITTHETLEVAVSAFDPDDSSLSFSAINAPGARFSGSVFYWQPRCFSIGDNNVTVVVTDPCGLTDMQSFNVTVIPPDPEAEEICGNQRDDNCNGVVDEGCFGCEINSGICVHNDYTTQLPISGGSISLAVPGPGTIECPWGLMYRRGPGYECPAGHHCCLPLQVFD